MPGHNNWFQIDIKNNFKVDLKPVNNFKKLSIKDAASITVEKICSEFDNIWVALSGGLDSEFVAKSFLNNNKKFTPVICQYPFNTESDYALHFCRIHNIEPKIINLNLQDEKIRTLLKNMARRYNSKVWFGALSLYLAEIAVKNNASLITGTGIITTDNPYPVPLGNQAEFCKYDFFVDLTGVHPGSFMTYTPELFYSILNRIDENLPTQELKSIIYELNFRPKIRPIQILSDDLGDISSELDLRYSFQDLKNILDPYVI